MRAAASQASRRVSGSGPAAGGRRPGDPACRASCMAWPQMADIRLPFVAGGHGACPAGSLGAGHVHQGLRACSCVCRPGHRQAPGHSRALGGGCQTAVGPDPDSPLMRRAGQRPFCAGAAGRLCQMGLMLMMGGEVRAGRGSGRHCLCVVCFSLVFPLGRPWHMSVRGCLSGSLCVRFI